MSPNQTVPTLSDLRAERGRIIEVAGTHGARNVRVYGSVARVQATTARDVDFLVDFDAGRSLFDLRGLIADLEELLGCEVDVTTTRELRPRVRDRVLRDAVAL